MGLISRVSSRTYRSSRMADCATQMAPSLDEQESLDNDENISEQQTTDTVPDLPELEQTDIAREMISYAPPGQYKDIAKNLSVVLDKNIELLQGVPETSLDHHQDQLATVFIDPVKQFRHQLYSDLKNSSMAKVRACFDKDELLEFYKRNGDTIVSPQSHVGGNTFYYSKEHLLFDYDPMSLTVDNIQPAPDMLRVITAEGLRQALEREIYENYVNLHYPKGISAVHAVTDSDHNQQDFVVYIEDHEFQPENRWNGKWRSEWMITINYSDDKEEIKEIFLQGGSKIHVHYYEDSNVQMVSKQLYNKEALEKPIVAKTDKEKAALIVAHISKAESNYHAALRDSYVIMDDTTFKCLRRKLPIRQTKFDWESLNYLKVGKEMG